MDEGIFRLQKVSSRVLMDLEYYGNLGEIESSLKKRQCGFMPLFNGNLHLT